MGLRFLFVILIMTNLFNVLFVNMDFNIISIKNLKNLNRVAEPPKTVPIEHRLKSRNIEYNFKWNQQCLSRVSNSLNSASKAMESYE